MKKLLLALQALRHANAFSTSSTRLPSSNIHVAVEVLMQLLAKSSEVNTFRDLLLLYNFVDVPFFVSSFFLIN